MRLSRADADIFVPDQQELETVMAAPGKRRPFDHDAHALIAAHRINGDTRQAHALRSPVGLGLEPDRNDLATVVMTAGLAQVVRALQFTTVRAFVECGRRQRVVAAAHAPARGGRFSFGDSHVGTCS